MNLGLTHKPNHQTVWMTVCTVVAWAAIDVAQYLGAHVTPELKAGIITAAAVISSHVTGAPPAEPKP